MEGRFASGARVGTTAYVAAREQDTAAGGHHQRVIPLHGLRVALGSVALRVFPKSRRIRAYLRWSDRGHTREKYLGEVDGENRPDNLQRAWALAREQGMALPEAASSETPRSRRGQAPLMSVMPCRQPSRNTKPEMPLWSVYSRWD